MELNSCLYECTVMHHRLLPVRNRFAYKVFMFYLDLDELDTIAATLRIVGRNHLNIFSFRDSDHLGEKGRSTKENIAGFLRNHGIELGRGKIRLLTHLRTFGHVFNPVSFYFCSHENGEPLCAVAEVGNTFREMKAFILRKEDRQDGAFRKKEEKFFYVSPFMDLDTSFDFALNPPAEQLRVQIDDYKEGKKLFISTLTGSRRPLNDRTLISYSVRIPFVTLKVIGLIHFQAALLWLKRLPYHRKSENPHMQKDMSAWNR